MGLAVLAIAAAAFSLIGSETAPEGAQTGETPAESTSQQSPTENMAEIMATDETDDMMERVEERNSVLEADIEVSGDVETANEAEVEPVVAAPESVVAKTPGTFSSYSEDKLALAQNGTVVLFFHANWCPSCRALESNITANASDIPENTNILKLDYDTATELKQTYGVVRQHTLVVVDANGNEVKKLTGLTNTLDQVVSQL